MSTQAERNTELADRLEAFCDVHMGKPYLSADEVILLLKATVALRGHETSDFDDAPQSQPFDQNAT